MDMLQRTYELLEKATDRGVAQRLSQRDIAASTGLGRDWVAKFAQRQIKSPGVTKVQTLYNFLLHWQDNSNRNHAA